MAGKGWGGKSDSIMPVQKPWMKDSYSSPPWQSGGKDWNSGGKDSYKGYNSWASSMYEKGGWGGDDWGGKYGGYGMSFKGKGKGGKKGGGSPPANSPYWTEKQATENRQVLPGVYDGVVHSYNMRQGWGFIVPTNTDMLPPPVVSKLEEMRNAALAKGKENVTEEQKLYFRKPDVAEGFQVNRQMNVTFQIYVDDKGAGACEINGLS